MHAPALTDEPPPLDAIRERLRRMTDAQLADHGRALKHMTSPEASYGPTRLTYLVQLKEARAEWKRRAKEARVSPTSSERVLQG